MKAAINRVPSYISGICMHSHPSSVIFVNKNENKRVKNEKITNLLTKTKTKTKNDENENETITKK